MRQLLNSLESLKDFGYFNFSETKHYPCVVFFCCICDNFSVHLLLQETSYLKSQVSLARYYEILLQEFAHGTEYIVNTMSREGKHFITDVWHYDKVPIGNKGNAYNFAALVRHPNETEKSLLSYTVKVLDALGFRYGPSHTELMLTPKGPRLIETAARPMGGFFPADLMRRIFGYDHASLTLDALLDQKAFDEFAVKPYAPNTSALLKIVISQSRYPVQALYYEAIVCEAPVVKRWEFNLVKRSGEVVETVDLESAVG